MDPHLFRSPKKLNATAQTPQTVAVIPSTSPQIEKPFTTIPPFKADFVLRTLYHDFPKNESPLHILQETRHNPPKKNQKRMEKIIRETKFLLKIHSFFSRDMVQ